MFSRPWRIIPGTGQELAAQASGSAGNFTKVGKQTYVVAVRVQPSATPYVATVTISAAGTAATASTDYPISSSDPTTTFVCAPGDIVSVYQASGSAQNIYMCELTR